MKTFRMLIQYGVLGLVICLWIPTGSAASNPVGVTISVRPSHIHVTVSQPTPLVEVLGQLCRATGTDCEGTELASESTVAPLSLDGNWDQVTSLLMDGAGLNYIMVAPSNGRSGKLWITGLSVQASEVNVATDCHFSRGRMPGHTKIVSGQEDSCAIGASSTSESRPPEPAATPAPENESSAPDVVSDVQPGDTAKSERGSDSPFPDGSPPSNSGTQSQSSGSPFPESLETK